MATAQVILGEEVVVKTIPVGITLTLNEQEAAALLAVLNYVGGSPDGVRGLITGIAYSLNGCGYTYGNGLVEKYLQSVRNAGRPHGVYFCNTPLEKL